MSRVVELLLNKGSYSQIRSRSILIREGFIHHWHAPLQATLGRLLEGYTEGLHYGDLESARLNRKLFMPKLSITANSQLNTAFLHAFSSDSYPTPVLYWTTIREPSARI